MIPIDTKVIVRDTRKGKGKETEKSPYPSVTPFPSFGNKSLHAFLFSSSSLLFLLDSLPLLYVIFLSICVTLFYCLERSSISFFPSVTAQIIAEESARSWRKITRRKEKPRAQLSLEYFCVLQLMHPGVSPSFLSSFTFLHFPLSIFKILFLTYHLNL